MAVLMSKAMGALNEDRKPVYPLFDLTKSRPLEPKNPPPHLVTAPNENHGIDSVPKRRVGRPSKKDKTLAAAARPGTMSGDEGNRAELLEVDPNNARRKRRRGSSNEGENIAVRLTEGITSVVGSMSPNSIVIEDGLEPKGQVEIDAATPSTTSIAARSESIGDPNGELKMCQASAIPRVIENPAPSIPPDGSPGIQSTPIQNKPNKVLLFNPKTGTIGSPPKKISKRIREARLPKPPPSRIVTISYGEGHALPVRVGLEIESILDGSKTAAIYNKENMPNKPPKSLKVSGSGPAAAPHPFFTGVARVAKPRPKEDMPEVSKAAEISRPLESITLGQARAKPRDTSSRHPTSGSMSSAFYGFGGKTANLLKFPGAAEPAWPWKNVVHTRGIDALDHELPLTRNDSTHGLTRARKAKYPAVEVHDNEDIVTILAKKLSISQVLKQLADINLDEFPPLPGCLRVPTKHFEAGIDIQRRIQKQLSTRMPFQAKDPDTSDDEIRITGRASSSIHPAISQTFASIPSSLSAFDRSQCETQSWVHKHSPKAACEVLQTGPEASILKEWLQRLIVMSTESGSAEQLANRSSSASRRFGLSKLDAPTKRKRKSKKLDGFVVSSDEEDDDMDEISEPEASSPPRGRQSLLKRTVVRAGDAAASGAKDSGRFKNSVVVSGPHGCGKTATVYAVAKELGFEVFEINSGTRRNAKDILDRVGDMTRNHLVHQSPDNTSAETPDEDTQRISDALDEDLKSGRQGTMDSFFQAKAVQTSQPKVQKPLAPTKEAEEKQASQPKLRAKRQKQSLILFEEVDILYKEDKDFWTTVMTLIDQSRRPVIMTCTDESVVPIAGLPLHAIIRLTTPPIELAVDYMLLVAAKEGHILQRNAVHALYESRRHDLRASLAELDFWCQFAVGDIKGGLDWYCPRWPPGRDVDVHGNTLRVVSEGTYEHGMGWISHDSLKSQSNHLDIEVETLRQVWEGWQLDAGDWQQSLEMSTWADSLKYACVEKQDYLASLRLYDEFCETMSAVDLCSIDAFAPDNMCSMDNAMPELLPKAREDFVLSHPILEASPLISYDTLGKDISVWMRSRCRDRLRIISNLKFDLNNSTCLAGPSEGDLISKIRQHVSNPEEVTSRRHFSLAFDPISEPENSILSTTGSLEASVFDRNMSMIATDIAPYVRSIVSGDMLLQEKRTRLSDLLSEGGRPGKKMRTTRAAMSALEGGVRSTTRRERHFGPNLNPYFVLDTGMKVWMDAVELQKASKTAAHEQSSQEAPRAEFTRNANDAYELAKGREVASSGDGC